MPAPEWTAAPAAALAFLTRVPLPGRTGPGAGADALPRAAPLFPLVGALLGLASGAVALGAAELLPALLAGLLAVAVELALTGALHVDGLADSADGLGGRDRGQALAIMRDHSLGAYGGAALALDLALKAAALGALAEARALAPVVAALAISRAAPLPLARLLPYARPGAGTGRVLADRTGSRSAAGAVALAAALALLAVGPDALLLLAAATLATAAVGYLARRRLGGVTGDVMGAAVELSATGCLVLAVALEG